MILVKRKSDGRYVASWEQWDGTDRKPGYRHLTFTAKSAEAREFTETEAAQLCDRDFDGRPYTPFSFAGACKQPEFERENVLSLQEATA